MLLLLLLITVVAASNCNWRNADTCLIHCQCSLCTLPNTTQVCHGFFDYALCTGGNVTMDHCPYFNFYLTGVITLFVIFVVILAYVWLRYRYRYNNEYESIPAVFREDL